MKTITAFMVIAAMALPVLASAQLPLTAGQRIRITRMNGFVLTGSFTAQTAEAVSLAANDSRRTSIAVPQSDIRRIESSLGKEHSFGKNFALGAGVAALSVGTMKAIFWTECLGSPRCASHPSRGRTFVKGVFPTGFFIGVPVGMITGVFIKDERWARLR